MVLKSVLFLLYLVLTNAVVPCSAVRPDLPRHHQTFSREELVSLNKASTRSSNKNGLREPLSGRCGPNVEWSFNSDSGLLKFTGSGDMYTYGSFVYVPWISYAPSIKKVSFEGSITSICDWAFYLTELSSVKIPDSITSIGPYAFFLTPLTSLKIPGSVTSIGKWAFTEGLFKSVTIPDSVTSIGESAFRECFYLSSVKFGKGVVEIDAETFSGAISLKSVTIPDSVESIGYNAFYNCTKLSSVKIGKSVTSIGSEAFSKCVSLKSVSIPASVRYIGSYAFYKCSALSKVSYYGNSDPGNRSGKVFDECPKLGKVGVILNYTDDLFCGKEVEKGAVSAGSIAKLGGFALAALFGAMMMMI